jgi:hypothetical protein
MRRAPSPEAERALDSIRAVLTGIVEDASSRREIERQLGYATHSGYLSRVLRGQRGLSFAQALAVLEIAGVAPSEFFRAVSEALTSRPDPAMISSVETSNAPVSGEES